MVQVHNLEESVVFLKNTVPPKILFIEMTQLLVSTPRNFQEITGLRKAGKPLIACLVFSEEETEVIKKLGLEIDYYLVMPETLDLDESFLKAMRHMADRVK